MIGNSIAVLTSHRQTRRQVARALGSGGIDVRFLDQAEQVWPLISADPPDLLIIDCDNCDATAIEESLRVINASKGAPPVVLLSVGADKSPLVELLMRHDVGNLIAKHGAIRAVFPVLDERELLVTCEKVIRRNIFGIDKYVGSWGVVLHRSLITSVEDKVPCLAKFEQYLTSLDCPSSVIPPIVTVAEELILNAVVHAPRFPDGKPKYEHLDDITKVVLEPHEYVHFAYGCDGQRLMLSVTDHFGRLDKKTLYNYLAKGFEQTLEAEMKPSGAGLGLSLSFRSIHQLIFNVQDQQRTEVIAGWYLRVATASEFRQVGKSLNLFWLPAESQPQTEKVPAPVSATVMLQGRIDETTDFAAATRSTAIDLRGVTAITSRGLLKWLRFIGSMGGQRLAIRGCPEPLVRLAVEVAGVLQGVVVQSVLAPYQCMACSHEVLIEREPENVFKPTDEQCASCNGALRFAGATDQYQLFVQQILAAI